MWGNPGLKNCQIVCPHQQFIFYPLNVFGYSLNLKKKYDLKILHNPVSLYMASHWPGL